MKENAEYLNYYRGKTIVITGASGYIGSGILRQLSGIPCIIRALVKKGEQLRLQQNCAKVTVQYGDITQPDIWKSLLKGADVLFHLAAQTSSKVANEHPLRDAQINFLPVVCIIETCMQYHYCPDILFSGTVTEVGFTKHIPVNETIKDEPTTIYDIHKLAAEKYFLYYSNQMKHRAVVLRLANVYGPGPLSSNADRGILNAMMRKALRHETMTLYGRGGFIRDYVYIDDVTEAFLRAGSRIELVKGRYFLIGSGVGHTIKEAVTLATNVAWRKTKQKAKIKFVPLPKDISLIEKRNFVANTRYFCSLTGWKPKVTLASGIERTLDFFMTQDKNT